MSTYANENDESIELTQREVRSDHRESFHTVQPVEVLIIDPTGKPRTAKQAHEISVCFRHSELTTHTELLADDY